MDSALKSGYSSESHRGLLAHRDVSEKGRVWLLVGQWIVQIFAALLIGQFMIIGNQELDIQAVLPPASLCFPRT